MSLSVASLIGLSNQPAAPAVWCDTLTAGCVF